MKSGYVIAAVERDGKLWVEDSEVARILDDLNQLAAALRAIIDRSHNDELDTSKVVYMRRIAERALELPSERAEALQALAQADSEAGLI